MASQKAAWGMEVGANAIKAVRLERDGESVAVTDFSIIPLKRVLSTPDIDESEIIRLALGQFISQKALEGERVGPAPPRLHLLLLRPRKRQLALALYSPRRIRARRAHPGATTFPHQWR